MNTAADVINVARSQIGTGENPPGSNHVKYWDEIGRSDLQGNPWCACFVTWCMLKGGVPFPSIDTPHGYVYCPDAVTFGRAHGELVTNPQVGDIVLFTWDGGIAEHTGLVTGVFGQSFSTIEGNSGDPGSVKANNWPNHNDVVAFFRPPYGSNAASGPTPVTQPPTVGSIATALYWLARRHAMMDMNPTHGGFVVVRPDGAVDNYSNGGPVSPFFGSMAGKHMNAPICGIACTLSGNGYWLIGEDGGIFNFGDAPLLGPAFHYYKDWGIGLGTASPLIGIRRASDGGYVIVADNPAEPAAKTYHITADGKFKT